MYCVNCGREIAEESRFCPYCGKPVEPRIPPAPPKKSHKKLLIGLVIFALLLALGLFLWNSLDEKSEEGYKKHCREVAYEELSDYYEDYAGKDLVVTGQVADLTREGGEVILLVDTYLDKDYDIYYGGTVVVTYDREEQDLEVGKGDVITAWGQAESEKGKYTSDRGGYEVPAIRAKYIAK